MYRFYLFHFFQHEGKDGCFSTSDKPGPHTQKTCGLKATYLGNPSRPFTLVDTPGFGTADHERANEVIKNIVDTLKNDIQWANIFVITFKRDDQRVLGE